MGTQPKALQVLCYVDALSKHNCERKREVIRVVYQGHLLVLFFSPALKYMQTKYCR